MQFTYRAKKDQRTEASGVIDALDLAAAVLHLKGMGLFPLEVVPLETVQTAARQAALSSHPLSRSTLSLWARTVGQGMGAGLSLTQALHLLAEQEKGRLLGQVAKALEEQVTGGTNLADAMGRMGRAFPLIAVSLVKAGEAGGALEEVMQSLAEQMEVESELIAKVRGALIYPLFVLTIGVGTLGVLLWVVLPQLALLFAETGRPLPLATRLMILLGRILMWGLGGSLAGGLAGAIWVRHRGAQAQVSQKFVVGLSRLPLFGQIIRHAEVARLSSTLGLLLKHGLPLPVALNLVTNTVNLPDLKGQLQRSGQDVLEGMSLSASFRRAGVREPFLLTMTAMGEAQGDLARSFHQAGQRYHQEVDRSVKTLSTLIEPMMILFVGLVVGGIVVSMMLPIFQINFTLE